MDSKKHFETCSHILEEAITATSRCQAVGDRLHQAFSNAEAADKAWKEAESESTRLWDVLAKSADQGPEIDRSPLLREAIAAARLLKERVVARAAAQRDLDETQTSIVETSEIARQIWAKLRNTAANQDTCGDAIYVALSVVCPSRPVSFDINESPVLIDMMGVEWTYTALCEQIYPVIERLSGTKSYGGGFVQVEFQSTLFLNGAGERELFSMRTKAPKDAPNAFVHEGALLCAEQLIKDFVELKHHKESEAAACKQ